MFPVALHHNALIGGDAVVGKEAVEVFQAALFHGARHHQQLAAAGDVVREHILLLRGDIAGGGVDHHAVGVLRDGVYRQQGEGLKLHVLLFHLVGEGGGQIRLAVALQHVDLGLVCVDHVVDGGGDGALAVEGGVVGVGGKVCLGEVDVIIGNVAVAVAALHHQAVVCHRFVGVLLGKGGVDVRVLFLHRNMVGEALVLAQ